MAISTIPKNMTDGSAVLSDGTGSPLTQTIPWENGDFSHDGLDAVLREVAAYTSRGKTLIGLRHTGLIFPTWSLTFTLGEFTEATTGNVVDMIRGTGGHSARISTTAALGDVICLDFALTIEGTDLGDAADHVLTLTDNHIRVSVAEGDPDVITLSGTTYGTVTLA